MDAADMAPPSKRRKLSGSTAEDIYGEDDTALDGVPAYAHAVRALHQHRHQDPPRIGAQVVEEVHVQAVKQALWNEDAKVLYPRQDTATLPSVPAVPAIPTFGVQTFSDESTTITYTPPATPSLPTLPLVPGATTAPTDGSSSYSASPPSSEPSPSSVPASIPTGNGTASSSSASPGSSFSLTTSAIIFKTNSTTTTSKTTLTVTGEVFFATLSNGDVSTITRSSTAFTTAFGDSTFTVSGYGGTMARTQTDDPESSSQGQATSVMDITAAGGTPAATAPSSSSTGALGGAGSGGGGGGGGGHSDTPPAGTIAGGVVGGAAGLAVLVLIAMLFVRWYRRKGQARHQALPAAASMSSPDLSRDGAPGMAERAGMMPFAAAVPALFRHQNRADPPETSERGFTRISGRKLPSQWSEGMSSPPPPNMPLTAQMSGEDSQRNLSNASFYRDSQGFYGGEGATSPLGASPSSDGQGPLRNSGGEIMMSPGPERHPTFHHVGSYHVPQPGVASGGFGRSDTPSSLDPTRSSRFTEDM